MTDFAGRSLALRPPVPAETTKLFEARSVRFSDEQTEFAPHVTAEFAVSHCKQCRDVSQPVETFLVYSTKNRTAMANFGDQRLAWRQLSWSGFRDQTKHQSTAASSSNSWSSSILSGATLGPYFLRSHIGSMNQLFMPCLFFQSEGNWGFFTLSESDMATEHPPVASIYILTTSASVCHVCSLRGTGYPSLRPFSICPMLQQRPMPNAARTEGPQREGMFHDARTKDE